jgi:hypothetical protein
MSRKHRLLACLAFAAVAVLTVPAIAQALKLGHLAPPGLGGCDHCGAFQLKSAPGEPSYKVPSGKWEITSWSTQGGGSVKGRARLLVFRRIEKSRRFRLTHASSKESIPANGSPRFATSIPVRGGDRLGIDAIKGISTAYDTEKMGDIEKLLFGCHPPDAGAAVGPGTSCPLRNFPKHLVNVSAKLRPR